MSNFGLDNAGSGFNLDDEDFGSMLDRAAAASEDDNGNSPTTVTPMASDLASFLEDDDETYTPPQAEPEPVAPEPVLEEFDMEPEPELEPYMEPEPEPEPYVEPEPEPEPEPVVAPQRKRTEVEPPPAPSKSKARVRVPTEAEQVAETARMIRILDTYRRLNPEEKMVAIQFVTNGDMDQAEDATVVVKVLNADPMLTPTMRALREAYEAEPVERAFYAMSLETRLLHNLGGLVGVFSGEEYDEKQTNLAYSRSVVAAIARLSDREINFVKATESVLAAAEDSEDE